MSTVAILLARGGSKGIPGKNLIDFCGRPLLSWSIEHCMRAAGVDSVWVSSDSADILACAKAEGARPIERPAELSGDAATSESGWLHALEVIEGGGTRVDLVVAPQVTSPLREPSDIERGLAVFAAGGVDSLFSASPAEDLCLWEQRPSGWESLNYDWRNRKRRQDHPRQYVENGSFYVFPPSVVRRHHNRFGDRIGIVEMEPWKMFEIDSHLSLRICAALMKEFLLAQPSR